MGEVDRLEKRDAGLLDRKILIYAMAAAMIWGMTHLYAFTRLMVSHDSLAEFYADARLESGYTGVQWKIALGRFVVPIYQKLVRTTTSMPWMIGMLSVLFLGLTVYVVARMFRMRRGLTVFLTAGILIANPAVFTTAATFIHDLDSDMLALLAGAAAAWCWREEKPWLLALGSVCVCVCMGIYASYLSVTVVLVIFASILSLLESERPGKVVLRGFVAIGMILAGLLIYALLARVMCALTGVQLASGGYNSIGNALEEQTRGNLLKNVLRSYHDVGHALLYERFGHGSSISVLAALTLGGGLILLFARMIIGRVSLLSAVLILVLLALLPVGMDIAMIANNGYVHDLMQYAFMLAYLLPLLLAEHELGAPVRARRAVCMLLTAFIGLGCWQQVVHANQIYLKKDLESRFTASAMTRIMTQLEQREDYVRGETPLLFAGDLGWQTKMRVEQVRYWDYTGMGSSTPIQSWKLYEPYLEYMMGIEVIYVDGQTRWDMVTSEQVHAMPIYPEAGSIEMIDGVLVVKVGPVNETR